MFYEIVIDQCFEMFSYFLQFPWKRKSHFPSSLLPPPIDFPPPLSPGSRFSFPLHSIVPRVKPQPFDFLLLMANAWISLSATQIGLSSFLLKFLLYSIVNRERERDV